MTPLILLLPLVILAGLVQLASHLLNGGGSFEDTFAAVTLASFLPTFLLMWIPETLVLVFFPEWRRFPLGGVGYLPEWMDTGRIITGMVWMLFVNIIVVSQVQRIPAWKAALVTTAAFIPAAIVSFTYVR